MQRHSYPRRGEVWMTALDPVKGHEIRKTRPVVVVTSDVYNEENWVVLVMPISSRPSARYDQVLITPPEGGLSQVSVTLPDQLRAVDRQRLRQRLGSLAPVTMQAIDRTLVMVLGLYPRPSTNGR